MFHFIYKLYLDKRPTALMDSCAPEQILISISYMGGGVKEKGLSFSGV